MALTRREAIAALSGAAVLTGCSRLTGFVDRRTKEPMAPPQLSDEPAVKLTNRFGFGPEAEQIEEIRRKGCDKWFDLQLLPDEEEPIALAVQLENLEINHLGPYDLRDWPEDAIHGQLEQAAILRAVYSPWQVRERLVDFWSNHFNIYAKKGLGAYRKTMDEQTVIRKHVLGKFPDMVKASSRSSAMLLYLDQQNSTYENPNENYARELLELHTLGVNGGYTQKDVMEVARCFTGYTEERRFLRKKGAFRFRDELHDHGKKVVLGQVIEPGGGLSDGDKVIDIVTSHPATAKHIATKLCLYFLGHAQEESVKKVSDTYLETGGDIRSMMRDLYQEFQSQPSVPIIKRPFDYLVSSMRALNATTDGKQVRQQLKEMGQPLYMWPMPDGYPIDTSSWKGSLLARWNFACDLLANAIPGTKVDMNRHTEFLKQGSMESVFHMPSQEIPSDIKSEAAKLKALSRYALALSSEEFQWR